MPERRPSVEGRGTVPKAAPAAPSASGGWPEGHRLSRLQGLGRQGQQEMAVSIPIGRAWKKSGENSCIGRYYKHPGVPPALLGFIFKHLTRGTVAVPAKLLSQEAPRTACPSAL